MSSNDVFESAPDIYRIASHAPGPAGSLPLTEEMLLNRPSGDIFGLSLNVGMGWNPVEAAGKQFLILSTQGGLRAPDGKPIALGYHTGHWEIGLLVQAAAEEFRRLKTIPFAGYCSDPCDGRTQGTAASFRAACRIATTRRSFFGGWRGRCRCGRVCSASPRATRDCRR